MSSMARVPACITWHQKQDKTKQTPVSGIVMEQERNTSFPFGVSYEPIPCHAIVFEKPNLTFEWYSILCLEHNLVNLLLFNIWGFLIFTIINNIITTIFICTCPRLSLHGDSEKRNIWAKGTHNIQVCYAPSHSLEIGLISASYRRSHSPDHLLSQKINF